MVSGSASQTSWAVLVSFRVAVWLTSPVVIRIRGIGVLLVSLEIWMVGSALLPRVSGRRGQEGGHALHHRLGQRVHVSIVTPALILLTERDVLADTGERHPR